MLQNLHVKNMALIREEEVSFGPGLNILTGETGAGKSIIIGSINVALGAGNFKDYATEGTDSSLVELVFDEISPAARERLEQMEIPLDEDQVILTRKFQKGRAVNRVNGETVPVSFIRELASDLIDIHGQHQHQSLLYPGFHLLLLDRFAQQELGDLKAQCADIWAVYHACEKEMKKAVMDASQRAKQIDLISYEVGEIEETAPVPGEDEQLERDYQKMANSQKIMEALTQVLQLSGNTDGAADSISRAVRSLSAVAGYDPQLEEMNDQLAVIEDLMNEFDRNLSGYIDDFTYDEQALYETQRRLDQINHLKSKYGQTIEDVLEYKEKQQQKLDQLMNYEGYLDNLKRRREASFQKLEKVADRISQIRRKNAAVLEKKITRALIDLNFLDVRFSVNFQERKEPAADGKDDVSFLISTNPGLPLRPLQDVASGGELSRIMLAIKSVMADQDEIGTLIFDEIDTGISGRTAQKVSEKMAVIARDHQVICITHLPQIAAMADSHYEIAKSAKDGQTVTSIRLLGEEESTAELARMLGGVSITQAVLENAREMRLMAAKQKAEDKQ